MREGLKTSFAARRLSSRDWWRINKSREATCDIEWTPQGGIVRAKVKGLDWQYSACPDVRFALDVGFEIVDSQREQIRYHIALAQKMNDNESSYSRQYSQLSGTTTHDI